MRICEGIYMVSDARDTVNSAFVTTDRGTVIIDTMRDPADGELLKEHVKAQTAKPISLVINTHFHKDHTFGNAAFTAPVCATETTRKLMKSELDADWKELAGDEIAMPLPQITFNNELTLHFSDKTLQLKEVGGHAPGTTIIYIPEHKTVYTTDLVFSERLPFLGNAELERWINVLRELEEDDIDRVIPGHGPPGSLDLLTKQRKWLEKFQEKATEILQETDDKETAIQTIADELDIPSDRLDMIKMAVNKM